MPKNVHIELGAEEALVLFDWLVRFNEREGREFVDQAEERVLFDLEASLEKTLVVPLGPDYPRLLELAREHVRDETSE